MNQKIINELIKINCDNGQITDADIEKIGAAEFLEELLSSEKLCKNEGGTYQYIDTFDLETFINHNRKIKDYYYANLAVRHSADINTGHFSFNRSAFLTCLQTQDIDSAYKYFLRLIDIGDNDIAKNKKLFFFMFSILIDVGPSLAPTIKHYRLVDLFLAPSDALDVDEINKLICEIYKHQFVNALSMVEKRKAEGHKLFFDIILSFFARLLYTKQGADLAEIQNWMKDENYDAICNFMKLESKKHSLSFNYQAIWTLSKELRNHKNGKNIISSNKNSSSNIYMAIKNGEYFNAREIFNRPPQNCNNVIIEKLLNRVCDLAIGIDPQKIKDSYETAWETIFDETQKEGISINENSDSELAKYMVKRAQDVPGIQVNSLANRYLIVKCQDLSEYDEQMAMGTARLAYRNGTYDIAAKIFKKIIRNTEICNLDAYVYTGLCYYNMGDSVNAGLYFDVASSICISRSLENPYQPLVVALSSGNGLSCQEMFKEVEKQKMTIVPNEDVLISLLARGIVTDLKDYAMRIYEENYVMLKAIEAAYALGNVDIAERILAELQNNPNTEFLKDEISAIVGKTRIYAKKDE